MANVLGFLKTAMPWIAAAATGNIPALLNQAAKTVQDITGKTVEPTPGGIAEAVAGATPEQLIALRKADDDFQLKMTELGFKNITDLESIAQKDRDSARQRQMTLKDRVPGILAFTVTAGFFGLLGMISFHAVPEGSAAVLNVMTGSLGTGWVGVVNYYFGSSAGSAAKSETIDKMTVSKP